MDDNQELNESNHEKACKLIGVIPKLISGEAVEFDSSTDSANKIFEWSSELKFASVSFVYSGDEVYSIKIITTMKEFFIEKGNWVIKTDNGIDVLTADELHSNYRIIPHSYFCVEHSKTKS